MASFGPKTKCGHKPGGFTRLTPKVLDWVKNTVDPEPQPINCQSKILKFEGKGYFEIPSQFLSSKEDVGFSILIIFKTQTKNGTLLYKKGKTGDSVCIGLRNGKVRLEIIYKTLDKNIFIESNQLYADNEEHAVTFEKARDVKEFTFHVDAERPKTHSLILRPGERDILDTKNSSLYLGGHRHLELDPFNGFITYIKIRNYAPHMFFGGDSDSQHGPFSLNGVKALNVKCKHDFDDEPLNPDTRVCVKNTIDPEPQPVKVNCQSQVLKFDGTGYFAIPHKLMSSKENIGFEIELSFKTKDSNALLFYNKGNTGDKISIELRNGKVLLEIIYKALDTSVILQSDKLYDDNEEHTVFVEKQRDTREFTFFVDEERSKTYSMILRPGEKDILNTRNAPLYLGGYPGLGSGGLTGCITYLKIFMYTPFKYGGDSNSKYGPFTMHGVKALNVKCQSECEEQLGYFDYVK